MNILHQMLEKETSIHLAAIRALYKKLDRISGLNSESVPIEFGYDDSLLGSYTQRSAGKEEKFYFSLLFIGYSVPHPLSKEDREDLYRHEYAHFMQYNMTIPKKYQWKPGIHGSAWQYCCSLVDAVPTPYYKAGEALIKTDYEKKLRNPIHDKTVPLVDNYRREQSYQKSKNTEIHFKIGETVEHSKYGTGVVENVEPTTSGVRVHVRFGDEIKKLDQKWLIRSRLS